MTKLSPLEGMPLPAPSFRKIGAYHLSPLKGIRLEDIRLTPKGLDILRTMTNFKTIVIGHANSRAWPAAEIWDRYDIG